MSRATKRTCANSPCRRHQVAYAATVWHTQPPSAAQGDQRAKAGRRLGSHVTKDKGKPPAAPQSLSRCSHNKQPRVAADLPPGGTTLLEIRKVVSEGGLLSGPCPSNQRWPRIATKWPTSSSCAELSRGAGYLVAPNQQTGWSKQLPSGTAQ